MKSLPTLIRELREAAYNYGYTAGDGSFTLAEKEAARHTYDAALQAVLDRLDQLGLR